MGRTLNEDDVLKEIDRWIGYLDEDMITRIKIGIKKLQSAQPEQRWIPCSERLPGYMELVLTWDGSTYCVEKRIPIIRDNDTDEEIPGDWWVSDDYDEDSDYYPNLRDGACVAWMPLPERYKEEGKHDETD